MDSIHLGFRFERKKAFYYNCEGVEFTIAHYRTAEQWNLQGLLCNWQRLWPYNSLATNKQTVQQPTLKATFAQGFTQVKARENIENVKSGKHHKQ